MTPLKTIDSPQSQSVASTITIQLVLPAIDISAEKEMAIQTTPTTPQSKKGLDAKLSNAQFIEKAPPAVVDVKHKAADIASEIQSIDHQIAQLTLYPNCNKSYKASWY